jgi:hypothetical protein
MNERIKELAEQAGWDMGDEVCGFTTRLDKFAELVAAHEREACATTQEEKIVRTGGEAMNVFKLIEDNGLTLHGDIEHFAELIRQEERQVVLDAVDALWGMERDRNDMFSEGYDYALGHIKEVVDARGKQ